MRLHPSFCREVLPDESPTSYWSAISFGMGRKARDSARDIGTNFQKIIEGNAEALAKLTAACGLPEGTFDRTALRLAGNRTFELAGEAFPQSHLTRSRVYVCPECIRVHGLYGQARWQLEAMRTCLQHERMLVPLFDGFEQLHLGHDFVRLAHGQRHRIAEAKVEAMPPGSDGLVRYLARRLDGVEPTGWLTSMPAYAAARSCEMVGLACSKGVHALWQDAGDLDRHLAGSVGYSMLSAGPEALLGFFRDLRRSAPVDEYGVLKVYGRIFEFVSHGNLSEAYEPLRAVLRDHLLDTVAFNKGDIVLGQEVVERRFHSVRSLGLELGLDARFVRRRLDAMALIPADHAALPNDRVLVDAVKHADIFGKLPDLLTRVDAEKYLGLTHYQGYALDTSLIVPFRSDDLKWIDHLFLRADLDDYLARLSRMATPLAAEEAGFHGVGKAAQRAKCPPMAILQLLLDGRLRNARLDTTRHGVSAIMVDPVEVRSMLSVPVELLTTRGVRMELGCCREVASALVKSKILPSSKGRHPVNNAGCRMVARAEVEAFKKEFVSLYNLADQVGRHPRGLRTTLSELRVEPSLDPAKTLTLFFRRSDIEPLVDRLRA
jgi:hypothetical protein